MKNNIPRAPRPSFLSPKRGWGLYVHARAYKTRQFSLCTSTSASFCHSTRLYSIPYNFSIHLILRARAAGKRQTPVSQRRQSARSHKDTVSPWLRALCETGLMNPRRELPSPVSAARTAEKNKPLPTGSNRDSPKGSKAACAYFSLRKPQAKAVKKAALQHRASSWMV